MDSQPTSIAAAVRSELINLEGVRSSLPTGGLPSYSESGPADTLLFVESGLVKIYKPRGGQTTKRSSSNSCRPGVVWGRSAGGQQTRTSSAEILQEGVLYVIPRQPFLRLCEQRTELWRELSVLLMERKRQLEKRSSCCACTMSNIAFCTTWAELAKTFGAKGNGSEYSIPLSQASWPV